MKESSRYTDPKADTTRRWVRVVGIIALLVVILVIVMLLAGGGHRPRPHSAGTASYVNAMMSAPDE